MALTAIVAALYAGSEYRAAKALAARQADTELKDSARLVTAWIVRVKNCEETKGYTEGVVLYNASGFPIYKVKLEADSQDKALENKKHTDCKPFEIVPPGEWLIMPCIEKPFPWEFPKETKEAYAIEPAFSIRRSKQSLVLRSLSFSDYKGNLWKRDYSSYDAPSLELVEHDRATPAS